MSHVTVAWDPWSRISRFGTLRGNLLAWSLILGVCSRLFVLQTFVLECFVSRVAFRIFLSIFHIGEPSLSNCHSKCLAWGFRLVTLWKYSYGHLQCGLFALVPLFADSRPGTFLKGFRMGAVVWDLPFADFRLRLLVWERVLRGSVALAIFD